MRNFPTKNLFLLFFIVLFSKQSVSQQLQANFSYCAFNSPENLPYLETYLLFQGNSLIYKTKPDSTSQAFVEVTFIFKQNDSIIDYRKNIISSPILLDSTSQKINFFDQQRISLPSGKYEFEISIRDTNSTEKAFLTTQEIEIDFNVSTISFSDVALIESAVKSTKKTFLTKSGYDLTPYTSDFYPEDFEKIMFYNEIYNSEKVFEKDEPFLINYFIESFESKQIVGNYKGFKRETPKPVIVLLNSFDIKKLPSGNYNLVIEIRNKENKSIALKKVFFQRSNPPANNFVLDHSSSNTFVSTIPSNELIEHIKSLAPISTQIELSFAKNQLNNNDDSLKQQFFYNFWYNRNSINPEEEWKKYQDLVQIAETQFSTSIKKGYETDRGRIFLKYGKPNTLSEMKNEPSSYPYEIWHYYGINGRSNVRFIFYNPDDVSNDYQMLHSTLPGEIYNAQWRVDLHKRTNQPRDFNATNPREYSQDRTDEYYVLPK
ncbi:MAG: GWxTD domain-containing protein [Flavobacteriales bacterium]|nr:GWxTD domain-containing protein [Flavobacteriales bacterium]